MKVLVVDIGGTSIKILATGHEKPIKIPSGPRLTPKQMVSKVKEAVDGWEYSVVSIGYPGPVKDGKPVKEPKNLGRGWVGFDFDGAFSRPVRVIERRRDAGAWKLQEGAHAVPRAGHRPRHDTGPRWCRRADWSWRICRTRTGRPTSSTSARLGSSAPGRESGGRTSRT